MADPDNNSPEDWIETVVRLARALGLNAVRVRWRLTRLQQSWQRTKRRAEQKSLPLRYEHAVCPYCGRVQDKGETKCVKCGASLGAHSWRLVQRFGLVVPQLLSMSSLLGLLLLASYFRVMLARPGSGYLSVDSDLLLRFGAYYLPALKAGEVWRFATAIFLHIGLWHLGFNLVALAQIGPAVEEVFGRGRMVFFFLLTGIASFAACQLVGMEALSAGASGAVMGLIGAAAGWGHREGTGVGRSVRNQMLKWLAYTTVFGVLFNANHVAHVGGFLTGGLLGFLTPSRWIRRNVLRPVDLGLGLLGLLGAVLSVVLVVRPPASSAYWSSDSPLDGEPTLDLRAYVLALKDACGLSKAGRADEGLALLVRDFPEIVVRWRTSDLDAHCQALDWARERCLFPDRPLAPSASARVQSFPYEASRPAPRPSDEFCSLVLLPSRIPDAGTKDSSTD